MFQCQLPKLSYLNAKARRRSRYRISELTNVAGTAIVNHLSIIHAKLWTSFLTIYLTILPEKISILYLNVSMIIFSCFGEIHVHNMMSKTYPRAKLHG